MSESLAWGVAVEWFRFGSRLPKRRLGQSCFFASAITASISSSVIKPDIAAFLHILLSATIAFA